MWKKDGRVAHATDYNVVHAHRMLHTYSYIYTQNYIIIAFLRQGWLRERACYVILTLPSYFCSSTIQ